MKLKLKEKIIRPPGRAICTSTGRVVSAYTNPLHIRYNEIQLDIYLARRNGNYYSGINADINGYKMVTDMNIFRDPQKSPEAAIIFILDQLINNVRKYVRNEDYHVLEKVLKSSIKFIGEN